MQFSSFTRIVEGTTIRFINETPIENVGTLKYYKDNASGSFTKKEIRWSFNNEYWSAWELLTQNAISSIETYNNYYFFLEVRYVGSGNVTTFELNYLSGTAVPVVPRIFNEDIQHQDASAVLIHDILQTYKVSHLLDASLLNGYPGSWYLNRSHHIGTQPISSITGLQNILNQQINNNYIDGSLAQRDASISELYQNSIERKNYIITGDNNTKEFTITHNLNLYSSAIHVYSDDIEIFPGIRKGTNNFVISFYRAPVSGKIFEIMLIGWRTISVQTGFPYTLPFTFV